jgi:hypothetical protein
MLIRDDRPAIIFTAAQPVCPVGFDFCFTAFVARDTHSDVCGVAQFRYARSTAVSGKCKYHVRSHKLSMIPINNVSYADN